MFALTRGELAIATFIFALVWGARYLPRLGEQMGSRLNSRRNATARAATASSLPDKSASDRG
jgi:Sec-independent protein translocase protein TatA